MRYVTLMMLVLAVAATAAHPRAAQGTIREIQFTDAGGIGTVSPDGRFAAFKPPATGSPANRRYDLALRDLTANTVRTLVTHTETAHIGGGAPVAWSADSTRLAFVWCYPEDKAAGTLESCEVRTLALDTETPETLVPRFQGSIELYSWSPDNRSILGLIRQNRVPRIVLISTADGRLRDLPVAGLGGDVEFDFRSPAFSPDGRFIAYSREPWQQKPFDAYLPADVFVLSIDDGDDLPLMAGPDSEQFVAWTRDGSVLFTTDRSGTVDLMRAKIAGGRIVGKPTLVRRDVGAIFGQALTNDGRLFYASDYHEHWDIQVADLDPATGRIVSTPTNIPTDRRRVSTPLWAEGGKVLLYRTAPVTPVPMFITDGYDSITMQDWESGTRRTVQIQHPCRDSWHYWTITEAPVPNTVVISVNGAPASCRGLYTVDLTTGVATALIEGPQYVTDVEFLQGGKELLYIRSSQVLTAKNLESDRERVIVDTRSIPDELQGSSFMSLSSSHDGRRVAAMMGTRDGKMHLVEVLLENGRLRRIPGMTLQKTPGASSIAWTADDKHLLYVEDAKPGQPGAVWRISAAGGTPEKIGLTSDSTEQISFLAVRPDGRQIAFQRERTLHPKLFMLDNFLTEAPVRDRGRQ